MSDLVPSGDRLVNSRYPVSASGLNAHVFSQRECGNSVERSRPSHPSGPGRSFLRLNYPTSCIPLLQAVDTRVMLPARLPASLVLRAALCGDELGYGSLVEVVFKTNDLSARRVYGRRQAGMRIASS